LEVGHHFCLTLLIAIVTTAEGNCHRSRRRRIQWLSADGCSKPSSRHMFADDPPATPLLLMGMGGITNLMKI
jgi:hypothetical protein